MHENAESLADALGLHVDDLGAVESFMDTCSGDNACERADPMVVAEAVCRTLPAGEPLHESRLYVRAAPALDGQDLVSLIRLVEEKLGSVTRASGRGSELQLDLDCEASGGGRLCRAVSRLACTAAKRLGWGTVVAAVEAVLGDKGTIWGLRLGSCEPLDGLHDTNGLELLLRRLILAMKELGLAPSSLDKGYDVWAAWRTGSQPWSRHRRMLCYGFRFPLLDLLEGRLHVSLPRESQGGEEDAGLLELLGEIEDQAVGRYWENGFRVSAVDPFALLRSLCPRETANILEKTGESVEKILESSGVAREEHGVVLLSDGTLVEANCSSYLDADNWVKIHSRNPERAVEVAKRLLRGYYEERLSEAQNDNMKRAYKALLEALETARSIRDIVETAARIREAAENI